MGGQKFKMNRKAKPTPYTSPPMLTYDCNWSRPLCVKTARMTKKFLKMFFNAEVEIDWFDRRIKIHIFITQIAMSSVCVDV